jgi:hypothetical protein
MKNLTKSDKWKEDHAVIRTRVFDRTCTFSSERRHEFSGNLPMLGGSTAFSRIRDVTLAVVRQYTELKAATKKL